MEIIGIFSLVELVLVELVFLKIQGFFRLSLNHEVNWEDALGKKVKKKYSEEAFYVRIE